MALVITWIVVSHCKNRHFFYNVNIWYMHVFLFGPSILLSNSSVESIYSSSLFDADLLFSCSLVNYGSRNYSFLWDYLWNIVFWSVHFSSMRAQKGVHQNQIWSIYSLSDPFMLHISKWVDNPHISVLKDQLNIKQ